MHRRPQGRNVTAAGAGELVAPKVLSRSVCLVLDELPEDQDADSDPNDEKRHKHRRERAKRRTGFPRRERHDDHDAQGFASEPASPSWLAAAAEAREEHVQLREEQRCRGERDERGDRTTPHSHTSFPNH
jgi:hypothetical protein